MADRTGASSNAGHALAMGRVDERAPFGVWAVAGAACLLAALAGCSSNTPIPPAANIQSFIGPPAGSGTCNFNSSQPFFDLGSGTTGISDGTMYMNETANVSCTVSSPTMAAPYTVLADVETPGGSFFMSGTVNTTASEGTASNFQGSIASNMENYGEPGNDCTVTLASANMVSHPIEPGRIWGTLVCPTMKTSTDVNATCQATIHFILTNCTE